MYRLGILGIIAFLLVGCATSVSTSPTPISTATNTAVVPTATATAINIPVKVYFSKLSAPAPSAVFPVTRFSPTIQVEVFALQQLIIGPTAQEAQSGLYSALKNRFTGVSNCGGADFALKFDMHGTKPEAGTTSVQFCRVIPNPGDTGSFIILNEVSATLKQFAHITKVLLYTPDGACFTDLIGCD